MATFYHGIWLSGINDAANQALREKIIVSWMHKYPKDWPTESLKDNAVLMIFISVTQN